MKMIEFFSILLLLIIVAGISFLVYSRFVKKLPSTESASAKTVDVKIKDASFRLEIADTPELRAKGLMNRGSLPENGGMLFVFDRVGMYPFWMKDTKIPLDIIWLDADRKVVYIKENAPPCDSTIGALCNSTVPIKLAKYVVELNTGTVARVGINEGDVFEWRLP